MQGELFVWLVMVLQLDQLVYTSFPDVGFKVFANPRVEQSTCRAFLQGIVHQHWNAYNPPPAGFKAAYLHQISPTQILFGWLYNDGIDDLGRSHIPRFLCYGWTGELTAERLDIIFNCLERGPIVPVDWQAGSLLLDTVFIPEGCDYPAAHGGIALSANLRVHHQGLLETSASLSFLVSVMPAQDPQEHWQTPSQISPSGTATLLSGEGSDLPPEPLGHAVDSYRELVPTPQNRPITKMALLIGVSEYGANFEPLLGTSRDVEAMQQVLEDPKVGGFTEVQTLINPTPQVMQEAMETLLSDRHEADLVLLYFSGQATWDRQGQLCLTTGTSRRGRQNKVVRSTVVPDRFLTELMDENPAQPQVVILDCWFSDAFPQGESVHGSDQVAIERQLGGPGRTLLTATTSTQNAFAHKGEHLSLYTLHLVEGLKTGAADLSGDGAISLLEWHQYASSRVQQTAPIMAPKIYGAKTDHEIQIALSPIREPIFKYRRQVEQYCHQGDLSPVNRVVLDTLRTSLGLEADVAAAIEADVFKPHQAYKQKIQEYSAAFLGAIQQEYPVSDYLFRHLKALQAKLGLTHADTGPVETTLTQQLKLINASERNPAATGLRPSQYRVAPRRGIFKLPLNQVLRVAQSTQSQVADRTGILWSQTMKVAQLTQNRLFNRSGTVRPYLGQALRDTQTTVAALATHVVPVSRQVYDQLKTTISQPVRKERNPQRGEDNRQVAVWSAVTFRKSWVFLGVGVVTSLILIMAARQRLDARSQEQDEQLQVADTLRQQQQYEECVTQIKSIKLDAIAPDSKLYREASDLLKQCQAGANWEQVQVQTLPGHRGNVVWSVAISPDGQTLVSNSADRTIKVWNLRTGELQYTLLAHGGTVWSAAISADGKNPRQWQ